MSIAAGLLVIALGAILTFAVRNSPSAIDLHVVGVVLMAVGGVGVWLRLVGYGPDSGVALLPRWISWRPGRGGGRLVEERVYDPMAEDPTVYRPQDDVVPPPPEGTAAPVTRPVVHEERTYER